jgi:hypothetical protein
MVYSIFLFASSFDNPQRDNYIFFVANGTVHLFTALENAQNIARRDKEHLGDGPLGVSHPGHGCPPDYARSSYFQHSLHFLAIITFYPLSLSFLPSFFSLSL